MKKLIKPCLCILALMILLSGVAYSQETKVTSGTKVSEKFLTTWKKVGNKTKEIRSFKTEKATTVAGVRGAEAEDEALKYLYFKGGVKYPSRLELRNAVEMLEQFVLDNPEDPSVVETKYFVAQCYVQLNELDRAETVLNDIVNNHSDTEFAEYSKDDLAEIKK
ncbi:hypothetical protein ACFL5L_00465 [candidate division KSB1 bacterium]